MSLWLLLNSRLCPLTFCLSLSLRNTRMQTLGKTSSLTARSIGLDSVGRAMWDGVWGNELSSIWFSFAKLESETQNAIQGNAFMHLCSLTLEKLEILTRNDWNLAVTIFFFLSALMTVLFIADHSAFYRMDQSLCVGVVMRGSSLQFQHVFLIVACCVFRINA